MDLKIKYLRIVNIITAVITINNTAIIVHLFLL